MRAVVQRVRRARVTVDGRTTGEIDQGLLVLASAGQGDGTADLEWMVRKIVNLRVFADEQGKMNLSVKDVGGSLLLVSQFTLHGDCRKGNRPSFTQAMPPDEAREYFDTFVQRVRDSRTQVQTGEFGAMMEVELVNDGPVTMLLDSRKGF